MDWSVSNIDYYLYFYNDRFLYLTSSKYIMKKVTKIKLEKLGKYKKQGVDNNISNKSDKPKNLFLKSMFGTFALTLLTFFGVIVLVLIVTLIRG